MSLAPSSTMTASVPCGTDQSSRASPSEAVSPETPASAMSTTMPWFVSAACSRGTKPSLSARPYPAVNESPSATIWIGVCARAAGIVVPARSTTLQTAAIWRDRARHPYERVRHHFEGRPVNPMNDISGHPSAGEAITLRGVNLSLGRGAARVHILRDIDVHIGRGEAVGMLGPSGSGKSTLLMVMTGLERADSGSVMVAGKDLNKLDEDELARFRGRNIGIVFQAFHLIPTMTALENVAVPLELAGASGAFARAEREL